MLRVAVCDDDAVQLERTLECVRSWSGLSGSLAAFDSGEALLRDAEFKGFDIYILDILMPGLDGIRTVERLRELGDGGEIIFLTSSNEFAADSYEVGAFFYLLKPVDCEKICRVLDSAAEQLRRRREHCTFVATREGERRIALDELLCVERVGRGMRYYCSDGVVDSQTIRGSFKEAVAELMKDPRFFLCGASYLLNFQHVTAVQGQLAILDDGTSVALPRSCARTFKLAWGNFWLGGK